jgi:hypothetical protein
MPEPYVPAVNINHDDSIILNVQVTGFTPGNWAEISGQITQSTGTFIPFADIQKVPDPIDGRSSIMVNVPPRGLDPGVDIISVITRVTEVQIWPTVLKIGPAQQGFKLTFLAQSYGAGQQGSQSNEASATPTSTGQVTGPEPPTGLTKGTKYLFTVEVVNEPGDTNT